MMCEASIFIYLFTDERIEAQSCKVSSQGHPAKKWQKYNLDPGQFDAKGHALHQPCPYI